MRARQMSEENQAPDSATQTVEPAAQNQSDPRLTKAFKERDALKERLRAIEDAQAAKEAKAKEAAAKEAGKWEEVLGSKDATIAKLQEQLGEYAKTISGYQAKERESALMGGLLKEAKGDRDSVEAQYLLLAKRNGWDDAPEDVDTALKERLKALKEHAPDLFEEKKKEPKEPGFGYVPPTPGKTDLSGITAKAYEDLARITGLDPSLIGN